MNERAATVREAVLAPGAGSVTLALVSKQAGR